MDKKGNAKKIVIVAVISVILLLVAGIVAVSSQSTDSINSSDDSLDIKNAVEKQLNNVAQAGISEAVQKFVEKFVEKRGVNPSDINEVSEVDFAALPEEVQIDNVDDSNLAIYEVDYNETGSGEVNDTKQVFVVTYSAEKLETTQDLIAHPDKRQFLQFGLTDETSGSFLNTAAGVPGSLNQGYVMMRQGSITGISTNLEVSESNDNEDIIDVIIYKNGGCMSCLKEERRESGYYSEIYKKTRLKRKSNYPVKFIMSKILSLKEFLTLNKNNIQCLSKVVKFKNISNIKAFVCSLRVSYKKETMPQVVINELEKINGWIWHPPKNRWKFSK